ncbi:MAG TPA: hypothetical protein VIL20_28365, partial [Sandaracinaceae bacterium]
MTVPPLLFAAHGDRARSWADAIRRSRGLRLLAAIDLSAGGIEGFEEALRARPDAAVAVWATGPLEAARLAERLVEHDGPSVLHPPPARAPIGTGVQVAHGWLTLSGIAAIERLFASSSVETVRLRVRGLPEGPGTGLAPALYHAATVVHRLGRRIDVERAVLPDEQNAALALDVDGVPWRVEVGAKKGPELCLVVRTAAGSYTWRADGVSESLERPGAEPRAVPVVSWAERCLKQLDAPVLGADLGDARALRAFLDAVEIALERRLPPTPLVSEPPLSPSIPEVSGSFRIELSGAFRVSVADEPETSALARIGLRSAELPDVPPLAPAPPPSPALPIAVLAYRLELRSAVHLTVEPQDEAKIRALLTGAIERRERTLDPDPARPADRAASRRVIDLYVARDAKTAAKLAALHKEGSTDAASGIGALLGFPACCVQAFVAQVEHGDETYDRYAIAARTSFGPGPWPAVLDDTSFALLSHRPCTYRCERSREQARALLDALRTEHADLHDAIVRYLRCPVLYFDHEHQLRFEGSVSDGGIAYGAVSIPWSGSRQFDRLAAAVALGDRLLIGEGALTVLRGNERLFTLERTDPGLGIVLP